jgi:anti-sigma-K factor RskA
MHWKRESTMAANEKGAPEEALSWWQLDTAAVRARLYRAPTPRERERWHALWLALQGWSTAQVATALGRDPHTVGGWLAASRRDGPAALAFVHTGGSPPP